VDEAIERLRQLEPALAELVRLRFFAGLTVEEAAQALGQPVRSVYRDWDYAKALLLRELRSGD
jgi:DNA-directed RNA polymerase specialized sigma24 family protein